MSGYETAFAGSVAGTPDAHVPSDSVSKMPCWRPELSVYLPTALQSPAEAHDTELSPT